MHVWIQYWSPPTGMFFCSAFNGEKPFYYTGSAPSTDPWQPIPTTPPPAAPADVNRGCTTTIGIRIANLLTLFYHYHGRLPCDWLDTERELSAYLKKFYEFRSGFIGAVPRAFWVCNWTTPQIFIKQI